MAITALLRAGQDPAYTPSGAFIIGAVWRFYHWRRICSPRMRNATYAPPTQPPGWFLGSDELKGTRGGSLRGAPPMAQPFGTFFGAPFRPVSV
jgi:hypothetical protein